MEQSRVVYYPPTCSQDTLDIYCILCLTVALVATLVALLLISLHNYADDIVLLAPSWRALQALIVILEKCCISLDLVCNTKKTVCMVFDPRPKNRLFANIFLISR